MRGKPKDKKEATTFSKKHSYLKQVKLLPSEQVAIENQFSGNPVSKSEFKRKLLGRKKAA